MPPDRLFPAPSLPRALRIAAVCLIAGFGLAACGKRGQLDPPPDAPKAAPATGAEATNKVGGRKKTPITAPKRDLPIDWILD